MTSLRELQRGFMRAVLDAAPDSNVPVVLDGIPAAQRLGVYAGNARANFSSALSSSYPVIQRLVGAEYFGQCARGFQREHPSRSGDLQPAGAGFAEYLDALHRDGEHRYLGDVARFEWLLQEAWLAADHAPLALNTLAEVPPEDYGRLEFRLHPSLRLFESAFPCLAIWQANRAEEEPAVIDLSCAPYERIAIMCAQGEPCFHALSAGEHAFLAALAAAAPFAAALEAAAGSARTFDAGAALRRFVLAAAIVDFR